MFDTLVFVPPITTLEVFINAHSGFQSIEEVRERLIVLFNENGVKANINVAHTSKEVEQLIEKAKNSSESIVIIGGGDGTISTFVSAFIGSNSEKIVGVLPLGTLNHFAQDLRIPLDIEKAVRVIAAGHQTTIDVGQVNGRIFVNNSSLGLYPQIVRERIKNQRLGHGKWPAFVWAALSVFRRYPFVDVRLLGSGKKMNCHTPFVFIGNNVYLMEGFKIGQRERLDQGLLSLYVTKRVGRLGLIRLALRALFVRLHYEKDFEAMTTDRITIQSRRRRLRVAFDGELTILDTPLHYRVLPKALNVIVPKDEAE